MPRGKLSRETGTELGHNNPAKTTPITTTFGKPKRHQRQGRRSKDQAAQGAPQATKVPPLREGYSRLTMKADSRALEEPNKREREIIHKTHGTPPHAKHEPVTVTEAQFDADLHPHPEAGLNHGLASAPETASLRTAADLKDLHARLGDFTNDELRAIPILAAGTPLAQGASYLDLHDLKRGQFTAKGKMVAEEVAAIVPRKEMDYQTWDRLLAIVQSLQG